MLLTSEWGQKDFCLFYSPIENILRILRPQEGKEISMILHRITCRSNIKF